MPHLVELRIEELLLEHREVKKKTISKYIHKYLNNEDVAPIDVSFCVHTGKYIVDNGHHRTIARDILKKSSILAKVEPCYEYNCEGNNILWPYYNIRHKIMN